MKKQVKFAETQTVHRLHQAEALPRSTGTDELQMAALKDASINFNNGSEINRPAAARCEPQPQHETTIQIPKTMTSAPFLKHSALTPAQKEYLYTIAASCSAAHVRHLIRQHYMNVLHRCIRTGHDSEGDDLVGTLPGTEERNKHRSEVPSRAKHKEKMNISAKNPGKSFPTKVPNRLSNPSASKQRNVKKRTTTSPKPRRKSPRRVKTRLPEKEDEEEEDEDEGLDDSLSECLSLLSLADWDDDTFSDLSQ